MDTSVPKSVPTGRLTFGLFEMDLKAGELWKAGYRVKLQMQPFRVLTVLVERAGEVVPREEIQQRVWGPEVSVDFEQSLGGAIKKVREALGDSADNPRFIQTLARRGYRFIAPVSGAEAASPLLVVGTPEEHIDATSSEKPFETVTTLPLSHPVRERTHLAYPVAFFLGLLLTSVCTWEWYAHHAHPATLRRISQITQEGTVYSLGDSALDTLPASVTDGVRLFISSLENGQAVIQQISTTTGDSRTLLLPREISTPEVSGLSPDGSKLLVRNRLDAGSEQPLWIVPVDGGSAFRLSNIKALDATWMPDAQNILYSSGNTLNTISLETGRSQFFATLPGRALWLRWSPDGKILRFTLIDSASHTSALWQIRSDDHVPHPLSLPTSKGHKECCGVWTGDGKQYIFQASTGSHTDLWVLQGSSGSNPTQITMGPLNYEAPATGRNGQQVYFFGQDLRSVIERWDLNKKELATLPSFLSTARRVTFSRDQQNVAWTNERGDLWKARADGSDVVRLTTESLQVFLATWSPDGTKLAMMARKAGQSWQIFLINADGGDPVPILPQETNVADPSFSADGKFLVFGGVAAVMGHDSSSRPLEILDLATNKTSEIPNSQGYFSPRWSPDGKYIAALSLDQKRVMLYSLSTKSWKLLTADSGADPVWSTDSQSLFVHAYQAKNAPIQRITIPEGHVAEVVNLKRLTGSQYFLSGLSADNAPLLRIETSSGNLYTMDLGDH